MTTKELANLLNGSEYPLAISRDLQLVAKTAGLVIVFGASDDLIELRGAICDELGCYGGGTVYVIRTGLLTNDCDSDDCPHFARAKSQAAKVEALWAAEGDYSWTYRTTIPHETFEVVENGEPYCRGIVFALGDVP